MPVIELTAQVAASPREFFDATLAVNQIPGYGEWNPAFRGTGAHITRLTEGVGTRFEFALAGTGATGRAEVVEYAPGRHVTRMSGGIFAESTTTWTAVPRGASCTVTYRFEWRSRLAPFSYVLDALMLRPRLRRIAADLLTAATERAEAHAARDASASGQES